MLPLGPKLLLCLIALFIPSDWSLLGVNGQRGDETTQETFTDDPNLMVNDPPTDDTVLVDVVPSTDDQAVSSDKNTTAENIFSGRPGGAVSKSASPGVGRPGIGSGLRYLAPAQNNWPCNLEQVT
ncbi:microfibrillar-associated protein 5 isoform X2 [Petaurus breviceps papuanus]|uniref:microfibrillar-associated protein 5 isoform X2 n=1 Tax=Petaurus breviceps papuanus TaxID=3040969 RepID=UPI0036DE6738